MRYLVISLMLLSGCASIDRYLDPVYAEARYRQAVEAVTHDKALACVTSDGVFWVNNGDWDEIDENDGEEYMIVLDANGNKHTLTPYVANPNCTPKE